jgi:enoyl-CoA hydratase/carnithine racemase
MSGTEAVQSGLFSREMPADELHGRTLEAAERAAAGATEAFLASKALIARLRDERMGLWESVAIENAAQAALCDTDDYREGFEAFQQKRAPRFTGGRA